MLYTGTVIYSTHPNRAEPFPLIRNRALGRLLSGKHSGLLDIAYDITLISAIALITRKIQT
ncbi:hypothetical protein GJV44_00726 [Candidatus Vallotia cooleyia]|nr:hypothetical protein GJV44_00726 [Candidatus Vallotia cooleyia]